VDPEAIMDKKHKVPIGGISEKLTQSILAKAFRGELVP